MLGVISIHGVYCHILHVLFHEPSFSDLAISVRSLHIFIFLVLFISFPLHTFVNYNRLWFTSIWCYPCTYEVVPMQQWCMLPCSSSSKIVWDFPWKYSALLDGSFFVMLHITHHKEYLIATTARRHSIYNIWRTVDIYRLPQWTRCSQMDLSQSFLVI